MRQRGGDFWRRLGGQFEPELVEQQLLIGFWLGVAGEHEFAAVGCRNMNIDHLDSRELLDHATWSEAGGESVQASSQRNVQAIGDERDEDVRLDASLVLVKDRPDSEITFEVLE